MKRIVLFYFLLFLSLASKAQNGFSFNCTKDTTLSCTQSCITLKAFIPDIHNSTTNYGVNLISGGGCFRPPVDPGLPGNSAFLNDDDVYTPTILLPFDFPFYGIIYAQLVISTNGQISFDLANDAGLSPWQITSAGVPQDLPNTFYERAIIMGVFHDIDIGTLLTSPNKQIKYDIIGVAPHRKWVLSFNKVPCYSNVCASKIDNTYQITLYEGLGLVEVHVFGREICPTWNQGRAMIGMQNYDQDNGIMAPGRAASTNPLWGGPIMNEAWRFTPTDGPTLFKRVELLDLSGAVVSTGSAASVNPTTLEATFPNICPAATTQYIVRSVYEKFDDPGVEIYGLDTINVIKAATVGPITDTVVNATCIANGTITVKAPLGATIVYSIDGGTTFQASPVFSVLAGTYTIIAKDNATGCSSTKTGIVVTGSTSLSGTATATMTSCPEALNGTITVTASQGTPGYTYALDSTTTYFPSNVFSGLDTGNHTVYIKDNAGCTYSFIKFVDSDEGIVTTAAATNASCTGVSNGTITVNQPSTGTAPFQYSLPGYINTPQLSPSFSGLAGATYNVKVVDAAGCPYSFTKVVGNDPGVTATDSVVKTACNGVNTGKIFVRPVTGVAPFTFSKDSGVIFQPADSFLNLGAGVYHIRVKDNVGCYFDFNSTVGFGAGVTATDSIVKTACNGASTGKIFVRPTAGTGPFTFSKDSGVIFQPADSFINLAAGIYHIRVKDNVGCYYDFNSTVGFGAGFTATDSTVKSNCAAATTGRIFIKTVLGIAPFQFSKDSGTTYQLLDSFVNLLPGRYPIRVKDAVGCIYDFHSTVGIGPGVTATDSTVKSNCAVATTGKIYIKTGLGVAPFQYSNDSGVTYKLVDSFVNLLPGRYPIRVKDAVGCTYDFHSAVGIGPGVTATDSTVKSNCAVATTGKIFIKAGLGVAPFQYSNDSGVTYKLVDSFVNLAPGRYPIRVKDAVGCTYDFHSTVGIGLGVTATDSTVKSNCAVATTGKIFIKAGLGVAPFQYSNDSGVTYKLVDSFVNLAPGRYPIRVKDAVGCTYDFHSTVGIGPGVTATDSTVKSNCAVATTGKIYIKAGLGVAPFQYSNDSGVTYKLVDSFVNLAPGRYPIRVKDAVGCTYDFHSTVGIGLGVTATDSTVKSNCAVATTGKIYIKAGLGVAPFQYSNDSGVTYKLVDSFVNLAPGRYSIRVKDAVGCTYDFHSTVGIGPGVTATDSTVKSNCAVATTGKIYIKAGLGVAPFQYSNDSGVTYKLVDSFVNLAPGRYPIRVKDAVGCTYDFHSTVGIGPGVTATDSTVKSNCAVATTGKIFIKAGLGVAPFQYSNDSGVTYKLVDSFVNLAPGRYPIRVRDAVGCTYDFHSTVGIGPGVTATDSTVKSNCAVATTGKIFIKAGLGVAPFQYSNDSGVTYKLVDSFVNLAPGRYPIRVKDAVGCTYDFHSTVGIGPGVTATDSTVKSNCAVATTGKIFIKAGLGVAPFQYSNDSGVTYKLVDSFTNLAPGRYPIRVKDAVGCTYDFHSTVGVGLGVTATDSTVKSNCAVATTGKIYINPVLGVAPFEFSIDSGANYQLIDSFTNLAPRRYPIRVRDAVGCFFDFNATVGIGAGVTATATTVVSNCASATTGKIFISPGLGVAPFEFSKDSGATYQLIDSFTNLAPRRYPIRVRDAVGCFFDFNATVGIGAGVTATATTVVSNCAVATTGKIFISPGLGVAPFEFSNDSGATYQLIDSFTNLAPRRYPIRVRDAVGCFYDFNATVGIGAGVNASFVKVNSACLGVSSGQIIVTPTGVAPFLYSIDAGLNYQSLDTIKNLASGNYTVQVKDAVGCIYNSPPQAVGNNPGVTAGYTLLKAACSGSATGTIIVKPNSGSAPFRYSLDAGVTNQYSDSVFRNLVSGAYNIRITDTAGCILNSPVQNITNNPGVITNPSTIKNSSCASVPNGAITVNVTAGIAPYSYILTSVPGALPQSSNSFTGLFSGSYNITIADSAGCTKTINEVIGNNPKIKIDSLNIVRPTCNGLFNGTIQVNASLGVAPYQYAIDNYVYKTSKIFTAVGAGSHVLHISDANGCVIDSTITVTEPPKLTNTLVSTVKSTCSGNADGQIVVNAGGGTAPYQYTLDGAGLTGYQAAATFPVIAGSYKVTVQDAKACKATINVQVDSVFTMFLDLGADTTICVGKSVTLKPVTNAETSIFTYTPAGSLKNPNSKNPDATPTDTTKYKLVAQWGICKLTDSLWVNVLHKPVAHAGSDVVICNDTTTVLRASATNLSGTVNYLWSPADLLDTKADTAVVIARPDTSLTYYTVTVTDNYGCGFAASDKLLVTMLPPVYAFAGNDTNAVLSMPHQLTATGAGIGGTYQWYYPSTGVSLSNPFIANPTAIFDPVPQPGTFHPDTNYYKLSVTATNRAGCKQSDTIKINVFIGPTYYCPNAFSPNGDGTNDIFRVIPVGIASTEFLQIYNRYGELVFATNRFMQGWDGTFKGKPQLPGAYVWVVRGKNRNGVVVDMKGTVMLVR